MKLTHASDFPKRNLTVGEYCYAYGVCRTIAYREMKSGDLPFFRNGDRRLIPVEAAEALRDKRLAEAGIHTRSA